MSHSLLPQLSIPWSAAQGQEERSICLSLCRGGEPGSRPLRTRGQTDPAHPRALAHGCPSMKKMQPRES